MDKDVVALESTVESKGFDFKEDCCGYTVCTIERGMNNPMNVVVESCETIRAAPENVVAGEINLLGRYRNTWQMAGQSGARSETSCAGQSNATSIWRSSLPPNLQRRGRKRVPTDTVISGHQHDASGDLIPDALLGLRPCAHYATVFNPTTHCHLKKVE